MDAKRERAKLSPFASVLHDAPVKVQQGLLKKDDSNGKRRGRPPGSLNRFSKESMEHARKTGELPHMFLLRVSRGEVIENKIQNPETGELSITYQIPTFQERVDAAKVAAPYFAPKLASVELLGNMSDDELDSFIGDAAKQAGVVVGAAGEGEEGGAEDGEGNPAEGSWL